MFEARPEPALPGQLRVPLGNLGACQCRWPVEEAPHVNGRHLFCGLPTGFGQMYCAAHEERSRSRPVWRVDGV